MKISNYTHFNPNISTWMHIDLNSCFATIEQQANPHLRGKPIVVAAYATDYGCILAPSIEAKTYGIKTGMRVKEARKICPLLITLECDPPKYRFVNKQLQKLFSQYSPHVSVRSIDEMLLDFKNLPILQKKSMQDIGQEIKTRIKKEIGDWLTVSIGISTNPYLAKVAAGLHKPDGLDEINKENSKEIFLKMPLVKLPYIKDKNAIRLNRFGIWTAYDFYLASPTTLRYAFHSITGEYWYLRLHGFPVDEIEWTQKTIGHSYHLSKFTNNRKEVEKILCKLVEKMARRIRKHAYTAQGIYVSCLYDDHTYWREGRLFQTEMYTSSDLFKAACTLLNHSPQKKIRVLSVSSYRLAKNIYSQLSLLHDEDKKRKLSQALDTINNHWGEFSIIPATMMNMETTIKDRIAFGQPTY